jgi:hypothetical protein
MEMLPSDDRISHELSRLIGAIALYFGLFEARLQALIVAIHAGIDEREPSDKRLPADQLTVWTKFMRESVRHEGMGPFAERIVKLMDEADRLASTRNQLLHGYMSKYDEATQTFLFRKFNRRKTTVKDHFNSDEDVEIMVETPLHITLSELAAYGEQVRGLCEGLGAVSREIMQVFFGQSGDVLDIVSE